MSGCSARICVRGDEPFVRVRRRHADVDDRDVRPLEVHLSQQRRPVLNLGDHLDVGAFEQPHDPLAREHRVLGDDYAHGSSTRRTWPARSTRPPTAPTRSTSVSGSATAGVPSSSTSRTSREPRRCSFTRAWVAVRPVGVQDRVTRDDVRRSLDGGCVTLRAGIGELHRDRRLVDEPPKRGPQAGLGEDCRVDPVGELAQVLQRGVALVQRACRARRRCDPRLPPAPSCERGAGRRRARVAAAARRRAGRARAAAARRRRSRRCARGTLAGRRAGAAARPAGVRSRRQGARRRRWHARARPR